VLILVATGLYWSLFLHDQWGWFVVARLYSWGATGLLQQLAAPGGVRWEVLVPSGFLSAFSLLLLSKVLHRCSCGGHSWLRPVLLGVLLAPALALALAVALAVLFGVALLVLTLLPFGLLGWAFANSK
jgi:hypothetical protein